MFQHKDIHKITWTSPDRNTKSQIDHILINGKWRSSLQDVKACRGADIASDHNLLVGNVTLKLCKAKRGQERGRLIDSARLKDAGTKQVFKQELKNRFQVLGEKQEMNIDTFNQAFREAGEKVLGYKKKNKEKWIQTRTWQKIAERKVIKQKINSTRSERVKDQLKRNYTKTDREVKRLAKVDKKAYVERLADEAEEAARRQDLKTLYRITKTLSRRYINNNVPVKDKEDNIIFNEADNITQWKEHFQTILNRPEPYVIADIPAAREDLDINIDAPTMEEVKAAIKEMKSGKAAGVDRVTAEMQKKQRHHGY